MLVEESNHLILYNEEEETQENIVKPHFFSTCGQRPSELLLSFDVCCQLVVIMLNYAVLAMLTNNKHGLQLRKCKKWHGHE